MNPSKNPIRSMTGFSRVRRVMPQGELTLSLKSLNHRGLDIRFHTAPELEPYENELRKRLAGRVVRGHIDLRASYVRVQGAEMFRLNRPLLAAYIAAFRQAAEEYGLGGEPDLAAAFRLPGMLTESAAADADAELETALMDALEEAIDTLNAFRAREGAELAAEVRRRVENIQRNAARMQEIRERAVPLYQVRLQERLGELLAGAGLEPQRLVQEAAILADRGDVGEELARLKIHAAQLGGMLDVGGEAGKRMDFLLQEMHRETNTILSKTSGIGQLGLEITDLALETKSDIEKIREQALNLE